MAAVAEEMEIKKTPFVIEWRDGFKIGVAQVDQEHRHLFTLVRALNLASVDQTVEELLDYVVTHFSNEQDMMEKSGYPAFEQHLKLHEEFAGQVADFLGSGSDWTEDRVQELRRFLNKWLIGHIMTHDLRFGKWHASHAAQNAAALRVAAQPSGFFARLFGSKKQSGQGITSTYS
ncbi:bacteriohemerythrin [Candidatus Aalborgicola defluviihabitans]|jgi:hemerythrin|uniref:bacteriohemerythrin n=1 Tax=Candidatus Aalborgicola defluviihabitans TaxID=3386187 RepID=UPI001E02EF0D|nr:hemerythrin family protein [Burkholderiales bacterium]MBK6569672.1 hemerythrin family protein [Burkholderiales bacterium]MBK7280034.1 hemerythrin family protein [Burkholderiales bacterium]MBK7315624.1 hemerythrin family protein [Burkholderiales bacterium]MBL0243058.1 hemerythrin family protein [Rhodoferax sp.]